MDCLTAVPLEGLDPLDQVRWRRHHLSRSINGPAEEFLGGAVDFVESVS